MQTTITARRIITAAFALTGLLLLTACQTSDTLSSAQEEASGRASINGPLKPFRDNLFSYRPSLEVRDGGDYIRAPYDEQRDINDRDELPVRKARPQYINRLAQSETGTIEWTAEGRKLTALAAGRFNAAARFTVIYLHGKGGTADWGFDDERFGGNFNRAKNLMVENGGAWISANFTNFESEGAADIAALIERQKDLGSAKIIIACGSLGTRLCWSLADNAASRKLISGMVVLGGFQDRDFLRIAYSGAFGQMPVYIAHGAADQVYEVEAMEDFYNALKAKDQPARMTVFDTGNHGTPVRMIDWRQALNWILAS